jgi:hypothetical protein
MKNTTNLKLAASIVFKRELDRCYNEVSCIEETLKRLCVEWRSKAERLSYQYALSTVINPDYKIPANLREALIVCVTLNDLIEECRPHFNSIFKEERTVLDE